MAAATATVAAAMAATAVGKVPGDDGPDVDADYAEERELQMKTKCPS